ncbi:hypothetical protein IS481_09565 [Caldimonas thermodepolymerans]|uniref:Uncharacterized protein n=1 Tax=Caldimonas thermodepolymerans TaxID=215580 RepID=A0A2S5T6J1_9BURK|nr:hypothetical protein [Caldimonas thermodepolymerans]PPE70552.1 hypothetical protein C1702_05240 [Caldimonas thermodepolymerans]QPC30064.1 hypothetical protein IS481_09565 [Caldimonas thermodepolymerans]RDH97691.1 hypothetical protein DES46_108206 [Caldimonas thermodepolymerans]TCP10104.1 hypothetical protein EV676_101690 [Caldimonas thermodepolymerans]UZG42811.1 hypothetical protein ONZ46_10225 [Caldimonas thermodepolymerans]
MIEKSFAALVFAVCIVLLLRMLVGERRRARLDAAWLRLWQALRRRAVAVWRWWPARREAARAAEQAIRRARGERGHWEGNVYRAGAFRRPRKPR